jgi:hypothetical protein
MSSLNYCSLIIQAFVPGMMYRIRFLSMLHTNWSHSQVISAQLLLVAEPYLAFLRSTPVYSYSNDGFTIFG